MSAHADNLQLESDDVEPTKKEEADILAAQGLQYEHHVTATARARLESLSDAVADRCTKNIKLSTSATKLCGTMFLIFRLILLNFDASPLLAAVTGLKNGKAGSEL